MVDAVDIKILTELQADAKITYAEIGKRVNLTAPTVFERVKRLEKLDIIKGYGAIIDFKPVKPKLSSFVRVSTLATIDNSAYASFLRDISGICDCYDVAGEDNFILRVEVDTPDELHFVLKKIRSIPGTQKAVTDLVLSKLFENPTTNLNKLLGYQAPA